MAKLTRLYVEEGKKSDKYNNFNDLILESIEVSSSRLMGVLAMRIIWSKDANKNFKYYQVMHLDFSEYGIDEYSEFDCTDESAESYTNYGAMEYLWSHIIKPLGSDIIKIPYEIASLLIEKAKSIANSDINREFDNSENIGFRAMAVSRLELMKESILARKTSECSENYNPHDKSNKQQGYIKTHINNMNECISPVSEHHLSENGVINYFIMRLVDKDYDAATYLSDLERAELEKNITSTAGIQTLLKNNIEKIDTYTFRGSAVTLSATSYYYYTYNIELRSKQQSDKEKCNNDSYLVKDFSVGTAYKLSSYEAAMQLDRAEYISCFDCADSIMDNFDGRMISFLNGIDPKPVRNGWLFTIYRDDNSHVNKSKYFMNDDVYGYAILSISGEFVLMSNYLDNITSMERRLITSMYSPYITPTGRYEIEDSIFQTFCETGSAVFKNLIDEITD